MGPEEMIGGEDSIPCAFGARTAGVHSASGVCPALRDVFGGRPHSWSKRYRR